MSATASSPVRAGSPRVIGCPACGGPLKPDSNWCPACGFTGARTMDLFPYPPPPLLPVLDAAGILNEREIRKIETARDRLRRRFPQFHWRVCTVILPPESDLALFGFWLLNACPLHGGETKADRASSVLLLINAGTGQVSAVRGYAAESCLSDDAWRAILETMTGPWRTGDPVGAVTGFFKSTRIHLERAWKSYGARHSDRSSP